MLGSPWPIAVIVVAAPIAMGLVAGLRAGREDAKLWLLMVTASIVAPLAFVVLMALNDT